MGIVRSRDDVLAVDFLRKIMIVIALAMTTKRITETVINIKVWVDSVELSDGWQDSPLMI